MGNRFNIGTNVGGPVDYFPLRPYANFVKSARLFTSTVTRPLAATEKDANGYPTVASFAVFPFSLGTSAPEAASFAGVWTVRISGTLTSLTLPGGYTQAAPVVAGGFTTISVTVPTGLSGDQIWVFNGVAFGATPSLIIVPPGHAVTDTWYQPFLTALAPFTCLRMMDAVVTNLSQESAWANRATTTRCSYFFQGNNEPLKGMPWEDVIALANLLNKDLWICIPHQADDNYVSSLATLLNTTLAAGLKVHVEYSNELWNGAWSAGAASSNTSFTIGTGSKTFTLTDTTDRGFVVGASLTAANGGNSMTGTITAYTAPSATAGSVTVNVTSVVGSGTFASWSISSTDGRGQNYYNQTQATLTANNALFGYDGATDQYLRGYRRNGYRLAQISNLFRTAFGFTADAAGTAAMQARVRCVLGCWNDSVSSAIEGLNGITKNFPNPATYYLWATATAPYHQLPAANDVPGITLNQLFSAMQSYLTTRSQAGDFSGHAGIARGSGLRWFIYEYGDDLTLTSNNTGPGSVKESAAQDSRMGGLLQQSTQINSDAGVDLQCYFTLASFYDTPYGQFGCTNNLQNLNSAKYAALKQMAQKQTGGTIVYAT